LGRVIVPPPSPSPIVTPVNAHCHGRRHCSSIVTLSIDRTAVYRAAAVHLTPPPIPATGDSGGDETLQLMGDGAGDKRRDAGG